jgi:hypothetical protein
MGIGIVGADGNGRRELNSGGYPSDFPRDALIVPKYVSFKTTDGWLDPRPALCAR